MSPAKWLEQRDLSAVLPEFELLLTLQEYTRSSDGVGHEYLRRADFAIRVEDSERVNDGLLLRGAEMGGVREQIANRGEGGSQGNDVRRIICVRRKAPRNLASQCCPAGKRLVQERVPQIKRESDRGRTIGGNRAPQQAVIGRFAAEVLNVVRGERVAGAEVGVGTRDVPSRERVPRRWLLPSCDIAGVGRDPQD